MLFHKIAELFPPMNPEQFDEFKRDIQAHGLREPITRWRGQIVDGRHRLQACEELGIEPRFKDFERDEADLLPYVISMNLARRHLTVGQRAALGARIEAYLSTFTKARRQATLKRGNERPVPENSPEREKWEAREKAGELVHVSGRSISDYKALEAQDPNLAAQVANGALSLNGARDLALNGHAPDADEDAPPARLPKRNAMLTASWLWPEPVETFVRSRMTGYTLNVCAGMSDIGDVKVDLDPKQPDVIKADMADLPFADESFDTVISDPPWKINWFDRWRPFFELVRVCRVGGRVIFNSYYVPWSKQIQLLELYVRQDERFANASVLSLFERVTNRNPD
jgi:Methyltransferase domain/ParB-like nuclease domain